MGGRRLDAVLAVLAMTAGATDAFTFLGLGGVFSSVMTANMVLLALSAGKQNGPPAASGNANQAIRRLRATSADAPWPTTNWR
jgi:hypothetical protein